MASEMGCSPAARALSSQLPAGASARVAGSSRAGYFTLNERHFVMAAALVVVSAIVACTR
jgi:hypothetical protein